VELNTGQSADSNILSHFDKPSDDNADDMQNTLLDSSLPMPGLHTTVFSCSTQSTQLSQQLRQDIALSVGDKYIFTFRGSAQYLEHNNFQYYTDNVHMELHKIKSLIKSKLFDSQAYTLIFLFYPFVTTELQDLHLILPKLSHIWFSLEAKAIHIYALMFDGQQFLSGWFIVNTLGGPSSMPYRPRNGYYYKHSWYQAIQTILIPPRPPNNTVPIVSYYRVTFARNTQVRVPD
jgi:hypothetical protein